MMIEEDENESSIEYDNTTQNTPTTTPKRNKFEVEDPPSSTLPAMTQDFVEYAEADDGIDLSKLFQSPPQSQSPQTAQSSSFQKKCIDNYENSEENNVENEVNGIFDILENSNSSDEKSDSIPSPSIITQPHNNCSNSKHNQKSNQQHHNGKNKRLNQLIAGFKHRKRRQQQQQVGNKLNHVSSNNKKSSLQRKRRRSSEEQNKSMHINDVTSKPSITTSNDSSSFKQEHPHHQKNMNFIQEPDHDQAFGHILNSIEEDIEDLTKGPAPLNSNLYSSLTSCHTQTNNLSKQAKSEINPYFSKLNKDKKQNVQSSHTSHNTLISSLTSSQQNTVQEHHFDQVSSPSEFNSVASKTISPKQQQNTGVLYKSQNATTIQPSKSVNNNLNIKQKQNASAANNMTTANSTNANNKNKDDDTFGSEPDFDFEEMDRLIAQRTSLSSSTSTFKSTSVPDHSAPPPTHLPIQNTKSAHDGPSRDNVLTATNTLFAAFSRYQVHNVIDDEKTYTKTLLVYQTFSHDDEINFVKKHISQCSSIHLRGEWYRTIINPGDIIHLVSISGQWKTDISALPVLLHTTYPTGSVEDDLLLILHPHLFVTPSVIGDAVGCARRAVLKAHLGSTGLSSKAAVIGTMRHALFQRCLEQDWDVSIKNAQQNARTILQQHVDTLIGCQMYEDEEAYAQLLQIVPEMQLFVQKYRANFISDGMKKKQSLSGWNTLEGYGCQEDIWLHADSLHATEESAVAPELGLKGNIDATIITDIKSTQLKLNQHSSDPPLKSIMGLELKTGHNQNPQHAHTAQLALYSMMLRVRHGTAIKTSMQQSNLKDSCRKTEDSGASCGGMLLYLNHEGQRALHVSSSAGEAKSLITLRNTLSVDIINVAKPRGLIEYEIDDEEELENEHNNHLGKKSRVEILPAPATPLPGLLFSSFQCNKCYLNRECMLYSFSSSEQQISKNHEQLFHHYTGHLNMADLTYFREWNRLIDLEADASRHNVFKNWLLPSPYLEKSTGKCVSRLLLDVAFCSINNVAKDEHEFDISCLIKFYRSPQSSIFTPFPNLNIEVGSQAVISADKTIYHQQKRPYSTTYNSNQKMEHLYLVRGSIEKITNEAIIIRSSREECAKIRNLVLSKKEKSLSTDKNALDHKIDNSEELLFRLDKEDLSFGFGTLRQNLIHLFTKEVPQFSPGDSKNAECIDYISLQKRMSNLRKIIVHCELPPTFDATIEKTMFSLPKSVPHTFQSIEGCDFMDLAMEYSELNSDQRAAVMKVVSSQDYSLVQGLPGTGKTSTIAFVTRLLVARGKRVLITSYTHAAVDNLMIKLIESGLGHISSDGSVNMIRVGRKKQVHPLVHDLIATNVAGLRACYKSHGKTDLNLDEVITVKSLRAVMSNAKIIGCSALTIPRSALLVGQHFDVVIVDEAGQISQPAILGALMAADSFVLVGDHMQLPPLVVSSVAEQAGYGVSMLKRLADKFPDAVAQLKIQYRMNEDICTLCNDIIYQGALKCANTSIQSNALRLNNFPSGVPQPLQCLTNGNNNSQHWLFHAIRPLSKVLFLCTDKIDKENNFLSRPLYQKITQSQKSLISKSLLEPNLEERGSGENKGGTIVNKVEKDILCVLVLGFLKCGLKMHEIGVISPYRSQVRLLEEDVFLKRAKRDGLEISTIDRFQGKDKSVIVLSFVRSNKKGKSGKLLDDFRRLNVAVSRAKFKLIMIGSSKTLQKGSREVMRPLLEKMKSRGWIQSLPENAHTLYQLDTSDKIFNTNNSNDIEKNKNSATCSPKNTCFHSAGSNSRIEVSSQEIRDTEHLFGT